MPSYIVARADIGDVEAFRLYQDAVVPILGLFGGRFLVRLGTPQHLEGSDDRRLLVVVEFPSMERLRAFAASPEYQAVKGMRDGIAAVEAIAVEGPVEGA
ncbi:MAG: DUF1330 domain-containing protein [Rhodospirillales bacterium]|nr:DUF1330 domain-containing protein [Rhodospirillales bacterium]MDP6774508.1 DUF1330 domain-containing protein [Rhodospirillales bacterium]